MVECDHVNGGYCLYRHGNECSKPVNFFCRFNPVGLLDPRRDILTATKVHFDGEKNFPRNSRIDKSRRGDGVSTTGGKGFKEGADTGAADGYSCNNERS
jgi:hypothetical protein